MRRFSDRYGPWALVAGGSKGLGAAFGFAAAARGLNVALVARAPAPLAAAAAEIAAAHGVETRTIEADLSDAAGVERAFDAVRDLDVGLVIHNAAFSPMGRFLDGEMEDALRALDLNARAALLLTHHFGRAMRARGRGGLVLVSSLAGLQGAPYLATYGATKAFERVLAEGLWYELREQGVDVLAVCAGATRTPGLEASGARDAPGVLPAAEVASRSLDALGRGPVVVPGTVNRLAAHALRRLLPARLGISTMAAQTRRLLP